MGIRSIRQFCSIIILCLTLLQSSLQPAAAQTSTNAAPAVQAQATVDGVEIAWPGQNAASSAKTALDDLPIVRYQGYDLPMQLVTVQLVASTPKADVVIQLAQLTSEPWPKVLQPAAPLTPPVLNDVILDPAPAETVALPTTPVFVLRSGSVHGQHVAVIALSPLFEEAGVVKLATALKATIPDATPIVATKAEFLRAAAIKTASASTFTAASAAEDLAPRNDLAGQQAIKIIVHEAGLQQITGQALADAGLDLATTAADKIQFLRQGLPVPLELSGVVNNRLVATSQVRFYAATAGDRWNLTATYWMTSAAAGGARMAVRAVTPGAAPLRSDVIERGIRQEYHAYSSYQPGPDGDHWYYGEIRNAADQPAPSFEVAINNRLPPAVGATTQLSLTTSTRYDASYHFAFQLGAQTVTLEWVATPGPGQVQNGLLAVTSNAAVQKATVRLTATDSNQPDPALWIDRVRWEQPAALDFQNAGAYFSGIAGEWRYQWQNALQSHDGSYQLYDITTPDAPVALTGADGNGFQDGPAAADYILAGPGTIFEPDVVAQAALVLPASSGAQAVYIAPQAFLTNLEPLLEQRRGQGYSATSVDVQAVYDAWSYGQVSAEAIRSFLRFARATWQTPPLSVVLVGDATWDPHNYEQKDRADNLIPAYLANVDPWLSEAACENCYAQLDGDDPLTGDVAVGGAGSFFAPDLWIGRLPVKSVFELDKLIAKIIRYENDTTVGDWRNTSIFLADNYVQKLDDAGQPVRDPSGNFARLSDLVVRYILCTRSNDPIYCDLSGANSDLQVTDQALTAGIGQLMKESSLRISRYYYDPYPSITDPLGQQPWRIDTGQAARNAVFDALDHGAGLVVYSGHSNNWQWAHLDDDGSLPGLLSLNDPDAMGNRDRLFIALSMTCLTSQFQKPANSGTTIDERLLLVNNGAVAVWGSSGLSVVHGHDALQRGFFDALWSDVSTTKRLGELLEAGYFELLTNSSCCQDAAYTFLLLGDPLTPARVMPLNIVDLPIIQR